MSYKVIEVSSKYKGKDGADKWRNTIVGGCFERDDGSLSLRLNPGVSIASMDGVFITIKEPYDRQQQQPRQQSTPQRDAAPEQREPGGDDIPF